jgi:hypothetical protein
MDLLVQGMGGFLLMRRSFFKDFWMDLDANFVKAALWCIGFTMVWVLVSIGLYAVEGSKSYFEIRAVLYFKIFFAAVIFLSRYLLFAQHRHEEWLSPMILIFFLLAFGSGWNEIFKEGIRWFYMLFKILDSLIWGLYIGQFLENMNGLFVFWLRSSKRNGAELRQLFRTLRQDTISLGIVLTFLAGLIYYYLTSFYLLDTLLYSYLLLVLIIGIGLGFYCLVFIKINRWIQQDIALLDLEIDHCVDWQQRVSVREQDGDMNNKIIWFHYLMLIRNYLTQIGRPRFPWQIWCSYLIFSGFILIIPYIFGLAIQVGSFK